MFNDLKQQDGGQADQPSQAPQKDVGDGVGQTPPTAAPEHTPTEPQPQSQPTSGGVNDMFADTDPVVEKPSAIQSGKIRPVSNTNVPGQPPQGPSMDSLAMAEESSGGLLRKLVIVIVVIVVLAAGAWLAFGYINRSTEDTSGGDFFETNTNTNANSNFNTNSNTNQNTNRNDNIPDQAELDDDFDGLSNAEEREYGTDILDPDTDDDGLFDREEVKTWKTNPLIPDSDNDELTDYDEVAIWRTDPNNPDSDDDGYNDGLEVANGYNPNGEGSLPDDTNIDEPGDTSNVQPDDVMSHLNTIVEAALNDCHNAFNDISFNGGSSPCGGIDRPFANTALCTFSSTAWPDLASLYGASWNYSNNCNSSYTEGTFNFSASNGLFSIDCSEQGCTMTEF